MLEWFVRHRYQCDGGLLGTNLTETSIYTSTKENLLNIFAAENVTLITCVRINNTPS